MPDLDMSDVACRDNWMLGANSYKTDMKLFDPPTVVFQYKCFAYFPHPCRGTQDPIDHGPFPPPLSTICTLLHGALSKVTLQRIFMANRGLRTRMEVNVLYVP